MTTVDLSRFIFDEKCKEPRFCARRLSRAVNHVPPLLGEAACERNAQERQHAGAEEQGLSHLWEPEGALFSPDLHQASRGGE